MRIDEFAVDLDVVLGCVGLGTEFGYHLAVHAHPAFGDQLFCGAAGRNTRGGYDFLDTFFHVFLSWISAYFRYGSIQANRGKSNSVLIIAGDFVR